MSQNKNISEIINNNFFTGVADPGKKIPFSSKNFTGIREGEIIFQNGDESDFVYLIIEGEVKLKFSNPNGSSVIIGKGKNEFFGEKEILGKSPRGSAAVANTDCIFYKLSKKDISTLLTKDPTIKNNILRLNVMPDEDEPANIEEFSMEEETPPESVGSDIETNEEIEKPEKSAEPESDEILHENIISEEAGEGEIEKEPELSEEKPIEEVVDTINPGGEESPEEEKSLNDEIVLDDDEGYLQWDIVNEESPDKTSEESPVSDEENNVSGDNVPGEEETIINDTKDKIETEEESAGPAEEFGVKFEEDIQTSGGEPEITEDDDVKEKRTEETVSAQAGGEITSASLIKAAGRIASSLDAQSICDAVAEESGALTDAWKGLFYIANNQNQTLRTFLKSGSDRKEIKLKFGEGLAGDCAAMMSIINLKDAAADTRFNDKFDQPEGINTKSMLCVPVAGDDGVLKGVIQLFNRGSGAFDKENETLITDISAAAALAVTNLQDSERSVSEDRNELLKKLTHFIINDINTPLLTIKHYADFIKKKDTQEDIKKVGEIISDQAAAAYDLLQSTLNYVEGMESLSLETEKISDVLDVALEMLAEYAESRNVNLFKKYDTASRVKADRKSFYQACFQIVKNACDAMPDGGDIYVTAEEEDGSVNLSFKDIGSGFPQEIETDIFKPFFSRNKENSVGLGLAIADKIITLHGGTITADNDPEKGAVFTISLPAAE